MQVPLYTGSAGATPARRQFGAGRTRPYVHPWCGRYPAINLRRL